MNTIFDAWKSSRIAVFINVVIITIVFMAILGGGGYLLDQQLDTAPVLFIIGLVLAFPLAQIAIYRKVRAITKSKLKSIK